LGEGIAATFLAAPWSDRNPSPTADVL
jgi:hypothetical protein